MQRLFIICLFFLLAGCASEKPVELGNQNYSEAPVRIYLVPMEGLPAGYVAMVAREIEARHNLRTKAIPVLGRDVSMFNPETRQYNANEIARHAEQAIQSFRQPDERPFILVLTPYDINAPEFDLRFLFAAHLNGISVISTARIDPVNYGLPRDDTLRDARLMKLIHKALGQQIHHYPIATDRKSVMYGPIMGLEDLDAIGDWY